MNRREFLTVTALAGAGPASAAPLPLKSEPAGGLVKESGAAPVKGAAWYSAESEGAGLVHRFPAGALAMA